VPAGGIHIKSPPLPHPIGAHETHDPRVVDDARQPQVLIPMQVDAAFLPDEVAAIAGRTIVVIDVLRATTSLLTLMEGGCDEILIAPDVEAARRYAAANAAVLTAGEEGGRAPAGFDFGNSPVAFARSNVAGRRLVMATTNGTRALRLVRGAPLVLIGCLRNRSAVAAEALAAGNDVLLVCSGRQRAFTLDDAWTAGAIADALVASPVQSTPAMAEAARAARALYLAFREPVSLFRETRAGQNLLDIGLEEDLPYCAQVDCSTLVPRLGQGIRLLGE
jgi:2-phosphosulfolactate phosphatase